MTPPSSEIPSRDNAPDPTSEHRGSPSGDGQVAYRILETPIGALTLASTRHGLVRIALPNQSPDMVIEDLADRLDRPVIRDHGELDSAAHQLDEYFAGHRQRFDLPLDLSLATGYRRLALQHLYDVPYGTTASYADLAAATGNPKAVRATGTACATNPIPIVIPCHRITRSDGSLGNYGGGQEMKRALLILEGAILA